MKTALHNLRIILSRYKVASALNMMGLAIAFTVCIIIFSMLYWEWSYNRDYEDATQIHQAYLIEEDEYEVMLTHPMATKISEGSLSIESFALISYINYMGGLTWRTESENTQINTAVNAINPAYVDIFEMEAVAGDLTKISQPGAAIVPESVARQYWGGKTDAAWSYDSVIGEVIKCEKYEYSIVGVYKDKPSNCITANNIYTYLSDETLNDESHRAFMAYYKLHDEANAEDVRDQIQAHWESNGDASDAANVYTDKIDIRLIPITELYFSGLDGANEQGNKSVSLILLSVALLILFIAVVNYFNFFMSLVPTRIKSVNISKIFGASNTSLRSNIIFESVAIIFISFTLSILFSDLISDSVVNFAPTSLKVADNLDVVSMVGLLALTLGVLVGIFTSWYMTKHSPAFILRGTFGRSRSGRWIRSVLTTVQFVAATSMIIGAGFVILQNKYLKEYDYGFNKKRLYISTLSMPAYANKQIVEAELLKSPFIEDIAYSTPYLGDRSMKISTRSENEVTNLNLHLCSIDFPKMVGLKLSEGRYFSEEDQAKTDAPSVMLNKAAASLLDLKAGDKMAGLNADVVGILEDFKFNSLRSGIEPIVFMGATTLVPYPINTLNIRVSANTKRSELYSALKSAMLKADPSIDRSSIKLSSIDESIHGLYKNEDDIALMISIFTLACIIIALLGVFGMVVFEAQHSRREVAVRKVFGSSVGEILLRFNSQIMRVLIASSLIALPLSWWGVNKWLSGYPYRCPMHWWVFAVGVIIIFIIVCLMVTLQSFRAASENPTKNLNAN